MAETRPDIYVEGPVCPPQHDSKGGGKDAVSSCSYPFDDYLQGLRHQQGINGFRWQQAAADTGTVGFIAVGFSDCPSDIQHPTGTTPDHMVSSKRKLEEDEQAQVCSPSSPQQWKREETDCTLSLSLNTAGKRRCLWKGHTCTNSETSETVSCYSRVNFAESLVPCMENSSINLDLSIAMYGSSVEQE
ncbi:uncharacterized protein LOC116248679 [Nymphaea colorata]|nr:uncharacterized protein LOC116248679 [Nymphaea colorata]